MDNFASTLERIVGDRLLFDEPLSTMTHFRVGGPARFVARATTTQEVVALIAAARDAGIEWVVLGGGTNILSADRGFDGLVIRMENRSIQVDPHNARVTAEAGALSSLVGRQSAEEGLSGLEWAVSLPGTIGGAIRGNAGCFGGEIRDTLVRAWGLNPQTGEVRERTKRWFRFGYRESRIKHEPWIVLRAMFQLAPRPREETMEKIAAVLQCRLQSQPKNAKCAGCVFKNVEFACDDDIAKLREALDEDLPPKFLDDGRIPAGWLIDRAELKGTHIGGAHISDQHGNFLLNDGTATADHIAQLIALIKTRVRDRFGIQLHEEVQYIGF